MQKSGNNKAIEQTENFLSKKNIEAQQDSGVCDIFTWIYFLFLSLPSSVVW